MRLAADKLQTVFASLGEGLVVLDEDLRVEAINERGEEILELDGAAILGLGVDQLAANWSLRDRGPFAVSKMRHHLLRGIPYQNDDAFVVRSDGEIVYVSLVMTPVQGLGGGRSGAVICLRDISRLKRSEQRLRSSEERFRRIFTEAPTGMVRVDVDGVIAEVNRAFCDMLGDDGDRLVGTAWADLGHPAEQAEQRDVLAELLSRKGAVWHGEVRLLHADGSTVSANLALACDDAGEHNERFVIGVAQDMTERKRLEVELRHAQKLEAVGRLAAGVAHEINTPIQFIGDNLRFLADGFVTLQRLCPEPAAVIDPADRNELAYLNEEVPDAISQTLDGVGRVATIVQAMKSFGHPGTGSPVLLDINEAVRTTVIVASSEYRYIADLEVDYGDTPPVSCLADDVKQVILNLLVNASHAIEDVGAQDGARGKIFVRTRADRDGVEISVSDTGGGIPLEVQPRIFDAFFTTKTVGRGTGQGLALAHAVVVQRHRGELTFDTEVGRGTTFRVWLPCVDRIARGD